MKNRRSKVPSYSEYQTLEPRNLLAATIYVDFGLGMSEAFSISDAQSASVNGPEVFGDGFELERLQDQVLSHGHDFNGDDVVDENDADYLAAAIIGELQLMFLPFDVSVQQSNANDFAQIQAALNGTPTNDAYLFVGGDHHLFSVDIGRSVFDPLNGQDNLAFVFSESTLSDTLFGASRYVHKLAAAIGKQAGHTFGVNSVEGGRNDDFQNEIGYADVMATVGRESNGELFLDHRRRDRAVFFTQADVPIHHVNGVSNGTLNTFDKLASNVGLNPDSPVYLTGTGRIDVVEIIRAGDTAVDILFNGVWMENVDISNGLHLETGHGGHNNGFMPDVVNVAVDVPDGIFVRGADRIEFTTDTANVQIDGEGSGTANGNVIFDEAGSIRTGDFNDTIRVAESVSFSAVDTGAGKDLLQMAPSSSLYSADLGSGDDLIEDSGGYFQFLDAGTGADIWDFSTADGAGMLVWESTFGEFQFGHRQIEHDIPQYLDNFERVVGSETGTNSITINNAKLRELNWYVDGALITLEDPSTGASFEFEDFNLIRASYQDWYMSHPPIYFDTVYVRSTAYDIEITNAKVVQVSSNVDHAMGDLEGLDHQVKITPQRSLPTQVIVSHQGSVNSMGFLFDANSVLHVGESGSVWVNNFYGSENQPVDFDLYGGQAADEFEIRANKFNDLDILGNAGNDLFILGARREAANGDLGLIMNSFRIEGGDNPDRIYLNDQGANSRAEFLISDGVVSSPFSPTYHEPDFAGVQFDGIEFVQIDASEFDDRFRVLPSYKTRFIVNGQGEETVGGDRLELENLFFARNRHLIYRGHASRSTWAFSNRQSVITFDMEYLSHVDWIATSAHKGGEPRVVLYDGHTNQRMTSFNGFGRGFRFGVNATMADVNSDGIPDAIVTPRSFAKPFVKIFDGRTTELIGAFLAYGEVYRGGVNAAVGNVSADGGLEIVTSKMSGAPLVRVFTADLGKTNYRLLSTHRPFGVSAEFQGGSSLAVGDMNFDGLADVISGAGFGSIPQVAIHDVSESTRDEESTQQINRFLAFHQGYRGGVNVAVGNIAGNPKPELFVGAGATSSIENFVSGSVRVFAGEKMPRHAPQTLIAALAAIDAYDSAEPVFVTTRMLAEGKADRLFVANGSGSAEIKSFDLLDDFAELDSFFQRGAPFDGGVGIG